MYSVRLFFLEINNRMSLQNSSQLFRLYDYLRWLGSNGVELGMVVPVDWAIPSLVDLNE